MKCMHCNGEMERGKAPFHVDRRGIHLTVDDVPSWICQQCGESYLEETEVESIQAMIRALEKETQKLAAAG
ncbi:MAG: YgiT-type zinc finger protein [Chitinivibrionia bacterium]|nr:YgiT-type zinc finger protein [Chitinivibrionia bacterium]